MLEYNAGPLILSSALATVFKCAYLLGDTTLLVDFFSFGGIRDRLVGLFDLVKGMWKRGLALPFDNCTWVAYDD